MRKNILFTALLVISIQCAVTAQIFYKDVAGIFYARCTSCHHTGANHYSFMNYTGVNQMKNLIQYDLVNNIMPPWKADTAYKRFQHERIITASEKNQIINWIVGGALKGDTTQAPAAPVYPPKYQLKGNADADLQIPTFTSTATSSDIYVCFALPTGLTQDRYIRAFEIVPGNKTIVHHAVVAVDSTGTYTSNLSGNCFSIPGDYEIGTFAPGTMATVFPNTPQLRAGIRIKAGSKVAIQMHYPKGSAGQLDSTKIRLYYYPVGTPNIRPIYVTTPLQNWSMSIPANTTQTFTAYYPTSGTLTDSLSLFGVFPHAHLLGKSMLLYAVKPGIDTIPMIRINQWDFKWQDYYVYKKLVKIPAGYRLFAKHVYDNTTANVNNPVPVNTTAGFGTNNEMLFDGIMAMQYKPGDELLDIESMMKSDSLFVTNVKEKYTGSNNLQAIAFPNPFTNKISIKYALYQNVNVSFEFTDLLGRTISTYQTGKQPEGINEFNWNGKDEKGNDLPNGIYFYKITAGDQTFESKIIKQQ